MKHYLPFKLFVSALCLLTLIFNVSCEEEDNTAPFEPYRLVIGGPDEVNPGDTATYTTSLYEGETYTWSVPAGATIVSGAGTFKIDVAFTADGSGDITVAGRGINGTLAVTVDTPLPVAEAALEADTVLTAGGTGTALITFDRPIATAPTVTLVPGDTTSTGQIITNVTPVGDRSFRVTYTAGDGDGTDQIKVTNAVTTAAFGSVVDTVGATFDLYRTDNTSATGKLRASTTPIDSTTSATISAIFSEPLRTEDSVTVSVTQTDAITMTTETFVDNVAMATEDGQTWTYEYEPGSNVNGIVEVSVSNLPTDLAGNETPKDTVEPIILQVKNE